MKPRKKRGFFNFLCAFLPGAAEMNMGFMKMGISMMAAFFGSFALVAWLSLSDVFVIIPAILWFYGFFHARNLTTTIDPEFYAIEDDYFWNELIGKNRIRISDAKAQKWIAALLILFGTSLLWGIFKSGLDNLHYNHPYSPILNLIYGIIDPLPQIFVGLIIIAIGIKLILGKKKEMLYDVQTPSFPQIDSASNISSMTPMQTPVQNTDVESPKKETEEPVNGEEKKDT
jgi:hypothetical protein